MVGLSRVLGAVLAINMASSCAAPGNDERRAILVEPSATVRAELLDAVRRALVQDNLLLATDALTTSSTLIIERRPHRTLSGREATGRLIESPEYFTLFKKGDQCVLVNEATGEQYLLETARCKPI